MLDDASDAAADPAVATNPAFELVNPDGAADVLLICDHASRFVPPEYDNLGLDISLLQRHIAWDIGAADVTRRLAGLLDAPAVLCGTSRLVVDCNRPHNDASFIPAVSDGIEVPGNRNVDAAEKRRRIERHFVPYHREIERCLGQFKARGVVPVVVSVHSFTPVMNGFERPWHVGLLSAQDRRVAVPLIAELRRNPSLNVGDNEPYSGEDPRGYAIHVYGDQWGLPLALFEVRQDLIDTHHGAESWAHILSAALRPVLANAELRRLEPK